MNEKEMFDRINANADNAAWSREDRQARKAVRKRMNALIAEAGLFILTLVLMALESAGLVSCVVAWPVVSLTICVMCFFGGYVFGSW